MNTPQATLTPNRKHRKLLKDGSGAEVWPEAIEQIFVQGLHQYWDSPWASYSRGRSRWRNQFLVEFLGKKGIERTKKQVASHIQVLRNMWKGQPEFYLVSSGEEHLTEGNSDPTDRRVPKLEDQYDTTALITMDTDEHDALSSPSTSSSHFSPPEHRSEITSPTNGVHYPPDFSPDTTLTSLSGDSGFTSLPNTPDSYSVPLGGPHGHPHMMQSPLRHAHPSFNHSEDAVTALHSPVDISSEKPLTHLYSRNVQQTQTHLPQGNSGSGHRVVSYCLTAEGMTPFQVKVEALTPPTSNGHAPPVCLFTKLALCHPNDPNSPPNFYGFSGCIHIANVWKSFAKCVTRVFVNKKCVCEESDGLNVSRIDLGTVVASLPASQLTKCRWLDPSVYTVIAQDLIIDDVCIFRVVHNLDRSCAGGSSYPGVELVRWTKLGTEHRISSGAQPVQQYSPSYYPSNLMTHTLPNTSPYVPYPTTVNPNPSLMTVQM